MSRLVSVMNCSKSSTVTAFDDMLKPGPMTTQCSGDSTAEPFSARGEPCLNRPPGNTTMVGHVGQSRITVPGSGTAAVDASTDASLAAGARRIKYQAANATTATANTATAALTITGRATEISPWPCLCTGDPLTRWLRDSAPGAECVTA